LDLRGRKWQEAGGNCIMRSFITCTLHRIIIRVMKSTKMRLAAHVARMGEMRYKILVGKPEGKRPLTDGWIILEWISEK
jgi:hypothetical protein